MSKRLFLRQCLIEIAKKKNNFRLYSYQKGSDYSFNIVRQLSVDISPPDPLIDIISLTFALMKEDVDPVNWPILVED